MLITFPDRNAAKFISDGFEYGFPINYTGPRVKIETKNLISVLQDPIKAKEKLNSEIKLSRMADPFDKRPISNLRCSPIGTIPKKTGGIRLITNLTAPIGNSVNYYYIT